MTQPLRIGLLRLVDSAPVIVAEAAGLFRAHGLDVRISIEPSWANIADKLAYGVLDAAVMLPPLALAASAGLRGMKARLLVPMSLSQGGNAITVRTDIAHALTSPAAPQRIRLLEWLHAPRDPPHPTPAYP
ncbi:MAG TPA: ABC transporter substrate-binding protein, partial [Rhodopila sp.]|nr:ABC transporter substrate-binding protein [Rhodopila sp.]